MRQSAREKEEQQDPTLDRGLDCLEAAAARMPKNRQCRRASQRDIQARHLLVSAKSTWQISHAASKTLILQRSGERPQARPETTGEITLL